MAFDFIQAARAFIAIDTISAQGNLAAVGFLRDLAESVGLETETLPSGDARNVNLLFHTAGASEADPLLLVTHTDTVPPGPLDRWTVTPPFVAKVEGDRIYGLGSADVKLDLLAKLAALGHFPVRSLRRGAFLLGTHSEEIGLVGAKEFVQTGRLSPRFAVCGEPSELTIVNAHKGYLVARVQLDLPELSEPLPSGPIHRQIFSGKTAHSSTPALGENAIEKALREPLSGAIAIRGGHGVNSVPSQCEVDRIAGWEGVALPLDAARILLAHWKSLLADQIPALDARFAPSEVVTNLGILEGSALEQRPLELWLDARLLPGHSPTEIAASFERAVRAIGGRVSFERQNPAVFTDPTGELCRTAQRVSQELGLSTVLQTKAANTEAAVFSPLCEAIVFGAGRSSGNSHTPNEHNLLSQIQVATDWYARLIRELCS